MILSFLLCVVLFVASPVWLVAQTDPIAQDSETNPDGKTAPPPIIPLLETARSGALPWRPDWPVSVPPDAFTGQGSWSAMTLSGGDGEYRLARNRGGILTAFPVFEEGASYQVRTSLDAKGRIRGFTLESFASSPEARSSWQIEILEERDSQPAMARLSRDAEEYFAAFAFAGSRATETWYDVDGTVQRIFSFLYIQDSGGRFSAVREAGAAGEAAEEYDYDNMGNISGVRSSRGDFSARYVEDRPRYWEGPVVFPAPQETTITPDAPPEPTAAAPDAPPVVERLSLQWDQRGLLAALSRNAAGEGGAAGIRYEYSLDRRGNWTERREIFMIPRFGLLVPVQGETLRRRIEYRDGN